MTKIYGKVNGSWREVYPGSGIPPDLPPGEYTLGASSIFLDTSGVGFAEFVTDDYRGRIIEIRCILSWTNTSLVNTTISTRGRPSNTFYRDIDNNNQEWNGRTISHRIDTFNASSLTEFNNGSAIGFNLELTSDPNFLSTVIHNVQLGLTIS